MAKRKSPPRVKFVKVRLNPTTGEADMQVSHKLTRKQLRKLHIIGLRMAHAMQTKRVPRTPRRIVKASANRRRRRR
ncbi:MAG: hypothetical protein U0Q18_25405 [Bryobacteraceae bacterium]